MPDDRLERTRHPQPTVPACVRLGHEWRHLWATDQRECIRCRLVVDRSGRALRLVGKVWQHGHWNVIEAEEPE